MGPRSRSPDLTSFLVYSDGSGTTGGPAGIAYVAFSATETIEGSLPLRDAKTGQAEILAAAYALDQLPIASEIVVRSDSQYLVRGWGWLPGWRDRGWKKVKNRAHWERLLLAACRHRSVSFEWVRGHDGDVFNERADELAGAARQLALETYREVI